VSRDRGTVVEKVIEGRIDNISILISNLSKEKARFKGGGLPEGKARRNRA